MSAPGLPCSVSRWLILYCSREDYGKARDVAIQAAKSQAYLYPIKVTRSGAFLSARSMP